MGDGQRFDALVNHPHWGSLWLSNCYIRDGHVIGEVEEDRMFGHPIMGTMNVPVSCIRKRDYSGYVATPPSRDARATEVGDG